MILHPSVNTSYGPAREATQASAVPSRAMTPPLPALSEEFDQAVDTSGPWSTTVHSTTSDAERWLII